MYCKYCGQLVDDNSRFCAACGGKLIDEQVEPIIVQNDEEIKLQNLSCKIDNFVDFNDIIDLWHKFGTAKKFALLAGFGILSGCIAVITISLFFPDIL